MADKLTLRPAASLESITSSESSLDRSTLESNQPTPRQGDFSTGVRAGLRRLGSLSGGRGRPANIQTGDQLKTASPGVFSAPATSSASQHVRSVSKGTINSSREKPLPLTPLSKFAELSPKALETMSRVAQSGSRTSTMDSATSQTYGGAQMSSTSFDSNASQSEPEGEEEKNDLTTPRSMGPASAGPSPAVGRPPSGERTAPAVSNSSTHLSGLMCNVHRTTGREPHPLVGATTTTLGDKLYVFGGRILSRTRPILTSDLYELDLVRRHWTKLETTGQIPPPRYFHSMCSLGDTKLVCYGGMSNATAPVSQPTSAASSQNGQDAQLEVIVMSDIYIYDAPSKTWSYIPTQDTPQGRYAHCATILPSSATFSSINAPMSAIHHNPSSSNPNQGSIGVNIDGTGGAEMIVVGGQDSANHYIEQISVFNLRSLKWTSTQQLGKSCGAYRSVVAPLPGVVSSRIGKSSPTKPDNGNTGISQEAKEPGSAMLIYSNYNFLDVKLELQIRSADGTLTEKPMVGSYTPPGLRFPNGGVIDTNFVVSGTYLTSSKQEYALWALDLRTLTWSRIDAGGSVFSQGSWNRGVLWNRRNTFVILGNRKRSLVEDYNHRRLNFTNVCMVELEAFGLYDNPRKVTPMSGFVSASSPLTAPILSSGIPKAGSWIAGGRSLSKAAEELGNAALGLREIADMDILAVGGERIPVNSRIISRRWGPYFIQLLREGAATQDGNDAATLRPSLHSYPSRNSSVTITPVFNSYTSSLSTGSTLNEVSEAGDEDFPAEDNLNGNSSTTAADRILAPPTPASLPPTSRPRTLYLPHTHLTLQSLFYFLYTSTLPPYHSPLCTPQILCSLLQIARPYRIDGLLEAVVERLHSVLDSRNAAAVFNAAAMAAGGGRAVAAWAMASGASEGLASDLEKAGGNQGGSSRQSRDNSTGPNESDGSGVALRINTSFGNLASGMRGQNQSQANLDSEDDDPASAASSATSSAFDSESESGMGARSAGGNRNAPWDGDVSAVIGLQKRGLRGLMEGRRLRERGASLGTGPTVAREGTGSGVVRGGVGLGIA